MTIGNRKLQSLDYRVVCVIPSLVVSIEHRRVTDGRADTTAAKTATFCDRPSVLSLNANVLIVKCVAKNIVIASIEYIIIQSKRYM